MQKSALFNFFLPLIKMTLGVALLWQCSAQGPMLVNQPGLIPADLSGNYSFDPGLTFWKHSQHGQISFKKIKKAGLYEHIKTHFYLQILGQTTQGAVRIRRYEGIAVMENGLLELRSQRCYTLGKRYWEDKLKPLERFDCDHLVFVFQSNSHFQKRDTLEPVPSPKSRHLDWFKMSSLHPLPGTHRADVYFSGQIMYITDLVAQSFQRQIRDRLVTEPLDNHIESKIKHADVIVWGMAAGELLRDNQELIALDKDGQETGILEIISRPGDTILCKWKVQPKARAMGAYTRHNLRGNGSLY